MAYFHTEVAAAADTLGIDPGTVALPYLAAMLRDLAVDDPQGHARVTTPLVDLLADALRADRSQRPHRLRHLGDAALFICGFFPESFPRRGLSYAYVSSMGRGAYGAAEAAIVARLGTGTRVFGLLAETFAEHARILDEVAERTTLRGRVDVAALYARWSRSGSPRIMARLAEMGLPPQLLRARGALH